MSNRWSTLVAVAAAALAAGAAHAQAQPAPAAAPPTLPPLFLKEEWRQRSAPPNAAADFVAEEGVNQAAVTNPALELKLYDPNADSVAAYRAKPPNRSIARDWSGPTCIPLSGHNQNPPPQRVKACTPTNPTAAWTG